MITIIPHKYTYNSFIPVLYTISALNIILNPFIKSWNGIVDELIVLVLFIFGYKSLNFQKSKEFYVIIGILSFFLAYSLLFGKNVYKAAIVDFLLFLKPFISFFIPLIIPFRISENARTLFKYFFFICGLFCFSQLPYINNIYSNTARYYGCCTVCAISYLCFSKLKKNDWFFFLFFLTPGIATSRAKFFTELIFVIFIIVFLKARIKLNIKWLLLVCILVIISIYISWEKFNAYFVMGTDDELARAMFYVLIPSIIVDFFPLGPGFGTFGTEAAARFYSPLYSYYNIDYIWGLREIDYRTSFDFLHDTFYPILSQFGLLGYVFYIWFWVRRWQDAFFLLFDYYKLFLIVFFIIAIENIAVNNFTGMYCVPYMMLLGMVFSKGKSMASNK